MAAKVKLNMAVMNGLKPSLITKTALFPAFTPHMVNAYTAIFNLTLGGHRLA
jgi:hypothetical protein